MKFIAKILIVFASLTLVGLVLTWHALRVVGNAHNLNAALEKSGAYEEIATEVKKQMLVETDKADPPLNTLLSTGVNKTIDAALVQKLFEPSLEGLEAWLKEPTGTNPPKLSIDLREAKNLLIANSSSGAVSVKQVKFEITKAVPDTIEIPPKEEKVGAVPTDTKDINKPLEQVKSNYANIKKSMAAQALAVILMLIALVLISLKHKRKMLRRPADVFIMTAIVVAFLGYPMVFLAKFLITNIANGKNDQGLAVVKGMVDYLLSGLTPYAIGLAVIGAALYGLSYLLPKEEDSKKILGLKKKKA